jgi:hypothetical protein
MYLPVLVPAHPPPPRRRALLEGDEAGAHVAQIPQVQAIEQI